jgi:glutamate-1-semialdehyde 2,1-aminomutase/spore coat polysaccharide biosynthesis protein SpsF
MRRRNRGARGVTTAVIVQARLGSERLPGKILRPLGQATPLYHVLTRCARIPGADVVVCAVPAGADNDAVAAYARHCGAVVVRGSESDLLDRHLQAARAVGASTILRVTSDCPLIDPALCGEVLRAYAEADADYACNNLPPLWPHGLDCEAVATAHLAAAANEATERADREHVTPWIKRNAALRRINVDGPGGGLERHRWTLDYPEDYEFFRILWDAMGARADGAGMREIVAVLDAHPKIAAINRMRIDQSRLASRAIRLDRRVPFRHLELA